MMGLAKLIDVLHAIFIRAVRGDMKGIRRLFRINTLFSPDKIHWNFIHMDQLFDIAYLANGAEKVSSLGFSKSGLRENLNNSELEGLLADHLIARNVSAFLILKENQIVSEQYFNGTNEYDTRISWSICKSITSLLLGALIDKGLIQKNALELKVVDILPELRGSGYDGPTVKHLLAMTSGVLFNEDYMDYHSDINRLGRVIGTGGSMDEFAATLTSAWPAGKYRHYVSVDTHVIGMVIRRLTGQKMTDLLSEHIIAPLGLEGDSYVLVDGQREPFVLGGMNLTTRDYARLGAMVLNDGFWNEKQIVSKSWIRESTKPESLPPDPETATKPDGLLKYSWQWWAPPESKNDVIFAIGIYGQLIYIDRTNEVVIVQNAGDTNFRVGEGTVLLETLSLFERISDTL